MQKVISVDRLRECERGSCISLEELINRAGNAVVEELTSCFPRSSVLVLCGPGNNGKDGAVVARVLRGKGWPVRVLGYRSDIPGVAKLQFADFVVSESIIVDAVFGFGLSRVLDADLQSVVRVINQSRRFVISVDVPSGVNSDTSEVMGAAIKSDLTVTFSCLKFCHVVSPGRQYCGIVRVKDIGIEVGQADVCVNSPSLWKKLIPKPHYGSHKYNRGYAVVYSLGIRSVGAVKLAALAALRTCPGAVAVACDTSEISLYAGVLSSVMYKLHDEVVCDYKVTAVLIGPGGESSDLSICEMVCSVLDRCFKGYVLDAGAISVFEHQRERLFARIRGKPVVLTPHKGEFGRIFPDIKGDIVQVAREAARVSGVTIVLKGHETIVASPDGRIVINNNASSNLATIGSGDVLAGMITGLVAAGMDCFHAACCGVWIHGECASKYGLGMIAEDIVGRIPEVFSCL